MVDGPMRQALSSRNRRLKCASRLLAFALAALTLTLTAAPAVEAQTGGNRFSGYVTVTSDYRSRGLSQSRGEPSLQIGGDYQHTTGLFAGVWAATVEYASNTPGLRSRRNEILYYAGYSRQIEDWSFAATAGRYTYPDSGFDYDYNELTGSVGYRGKVFYTAAHTGDLYGRDVSAFNHEVAVRLPIPSNAEVSATLGSFAADAIGVDYTHWNVGVSKTLRRFSLDLRYYDNDYGFDGPLGMAGEGDWVLSASYGFSSR